MLLRALLLVLPVVQATFDVELTTDAPQPKTWWAKHLFPNYYTAGLLSTRDIKYAAEDGFKSIITVIPQTAKTALGNGEYIPTTTEEKALAESLGLDHAEVLTAAEGWNFKTVSGVHRMVNAISSVRKPILIHCIVSFSATFLTLNALANLTASNPNFSPRVQVDQIFTKADEIGLNFRAQDLVEVIKSANHLTNITVPTSPWVSAGGRNFWHGKRFAEELYISGQLSTQHLAMIAMDGYKTILNLRLGPTKPGTTTNSQEEVTLLNIKDGTSAMGQRQVAANLEANRLNASLPNTYVSANATKNYESSNPDQFGDHVGYNETLESKRIHETSSNYTHLPIQITGYSLSLYLRNRHQLMLALDNPPALFHCYSGERAAVLAVLAHSEKQRLSSASGLRMLQHLGFKQQPAGVEQLYQEVLDQTSAAVYHATAPALVLLAVLFAL